MDVTGRATQPLNLVMLDDDPAAVADNPPRIRLLDDDPAARLAPFMPLAGDVLQAFAGDSCRTFRRASSSSREIARSSTFC